MIKQDTLFFFIHLDLNRFKQKQKQRPVAFEWGDLDSGVCSPFTIAVRNQTLQGTWKKSGSCASHGRALLRLPFKKEPASRSTGSPSSSCHTCGIHCCACSNQVHDVTKLFPGNGQACWGNRAGPLWPNAGLFYWAIFALGLLIGLAKISQSWVAVWGFSYPLLLYSSFLL